MDVFAVFYFSWFETNFLFWQKWCVDVKSSVELVLIRIKESFVQYSLLYSLGGYSFFLSFIFLLFILGYKFGELGSLCESIKKILVNLAFPERIWKLGTCPNFPTHTWDLLGGIYKKMAKLAQDNRICKVELIHGKFGTW